MYNTILIRDEWVEGVLQIPRYFFPIDNNGRETSSPLPVQSVQSMHILWRQLKVKHIKVIYYSLLSYTLWDDNTLLLNVEPDQDVGWSLPVFLCNIFNFLLRQQIRVSRLSPGSVRGSEGTVGSYYNVSLSTELYKLWLSQVRVQLHLINRWFYLAVVADLTQGKRLNK